jgi:23S rRNA (cytidine1920-2'-O)/16S rRNA (cytidine1409-2'-O)-methyltransferase
MTRGTPDTQRADVALVERGLAPSRARANAMILEGLVRSGDRRVEKAGDLIRVDAPLSVAGPDHPYVGRGGIKLAAALDAFAIDPRGLVCLDVGASTGGFTDCLLRRGARRVYAVDVGHGQLHWRLRQDPRVVVMEGRHGARLVPGDFPEAPDLVTVDCSFISVLKVLPAIARLLRPGGRVVALVKPQFEAGPKAAPKGVVRDPSVHEAVLRRVVDEAPALGLEPLGVVASPLVGPGGNREFFVLFGAHAREDAVTPADQRDDASRPVEEIRRAVRGPGSGAS